MPSLSYESLVAENAQLATFGRRTIDVADALVGCRQSRAAIDDPEVAARATRRIIQLSLSRGTAKIARRARCRDLGAEFARADAYEVQLMCAKRRRSPRAWKRGLCRRED